MMDEEGQNKLIAKYGGTREDFYDRNLDPPEYGDEPCPDRVLAVSLNEAEHELLVALFYNAACPEEKVICDADWEPMVKLAAKLGLGDIRQF